MIDPQRLVEQLSEKFELSDDTCHQISASSSVPPPSTTSTTTTSIVGLTSASTFIAQKSFCNFAVPQFATHWGIVCEFAPDVKFLYHLQYDHEKRQVLFNAIIRQDQWNRHNITHVGETPYDPVKVTLIGKRLLDNFVALGSYHFIFWNCQLWAKLFLKILCGDIDFASITSADATCLVLCAISIPTPIITTQWRQELDKTRVLIDKVMKDLNTATGDELKQIADQGVAFIVLSTLTDPENVAKIETLRESKHHLFKQILSLLGIN